MITKHDIATNWLPRYTGLRISEIADYVLITNFQNYVERFAEKFDVPVNGLDRPMSSATSPDGVTIINYGIGSPNAALIMDLLVARMPKGVLFLGKCGGLKESSEIGHFVLPIAAIRGDGTSNDYFPQEVPALPSFKLHKFVSDKVLEHGQEYRTGVVYTTNRRVWEWDTDFRSKLKDLSCLAIDMETATVFIVGHKNGIPRGALLLVSDVPIMPDGVKTEESDRRVSENFVDMHLRIGIEAMTDIRANGEEIKHLRWED